MPGWALALVVVGVLVTMEQISPLLAGVLFCLWIAKDFAFYPLVRVAYEPSPSHGAGPLIGALGTATTPLDPEGWVRVGSELWRARVDAAGAPIEAGAAVRVLDVRDLTLQVEPV